MTDWTTCRVVRDRTGRLRLVEDGTPVYSGEPIGAMDYEYDGPFAPVLDADGQPVVRTVGDLTARHQLARSRIRVAGREGKLKIVKPSDAYPGTVTLIWGDWWEDAALEEPCEVLP